MGKSKLVSYFTLLIFICSWITINLSFPAITIAMSSDHQLRFENKDGKLQVVFFHPESEEHEHSSIHEQDHHNFQFNYSQPNHEHNFQLITTDAEIIVPVHSSLKIDSERGPPLILISEAFNFIPGDYFPYRYYKYPSDINTNSLSLKTIVLLI